MGTAHSRGYKLRSSGYNAQMFLFMFSTYRFDEFRFLAFLNSLQMQNVFEGDLEQMPLSNSDFLLRLKPMQSDY